ncbi:MAG: class I SAM-dependent methyltransferase [Lachnospiraceae bacterium]|nr:class I SAM-dependent methyltransferase [Lachnospiraceae bacterium]
MDAYTDFARVYDELMDNIPYDKWFEYLHSLLKEFKIEDGIVAELGCGSGKMTRKLAGAGYDMIGIDLSMDMLQIAMEKKYEDKNATKKDILYLNQDMREMELYGTVRAFVSVGDSMNYLLEKKDLVQVMKLCNNYLDEGGYLIFDLKTAHMYRDLMGNRTITDTRDDVTLIWDNYYDKDKHLNEYGMTIYTDSGKTDEYGNAYFTRFEEKHLQRAYSLSEIKSAVKQSGMELVAIYDAFTHNEPTRKSERVYVIARETHQEGKKYI